MVRRPPTRSSILIALILLAALLGWTLLALTSPAVRALDSRSVAPPLEPTSPTAQIAAAFALLTWPGLAYLALLGIALWAASRRLRQLSVALVLTAVVGWGGAGLSALLIGRPRPPERST